MDDSDITFRYIGPKKQDGVSLFQIETDWSFFTITGLFYLVLISDLGR